MEKHITFGFCIVLAALLLILPANAEKSTFHKSNRPPELTKSVGANPKIATFLKSLKRISTPGELHKALESANFSEAELQTLTGKLKAPEYKTKIDQLQKMAETRSSHTATKHRGKTPEQIKRQKQRELEAPLNRTLKHQAQNIQNRLNRLQRVSVSPRVQASAGRTPINEMRSARRLPGSDSDAQITGLDPRLVVIGETVTIQGTGFGDSPGRVVLIIGANLAECGVSAWRDQRITAVIPETLQPDVSCVNAVQPEYTFSDGSTDRPRGAARQLVTLWVKLAGGETGPTAEIQIQPDTETFHPEITSVFPEEISPGGEFLIEGRHFMETADPRDAPAGSLIVRFGREELSIDIIEWRDTYIRAYVPESTSGLAAYPSGTIQVGNCLGFETTYGRVAFRPAEEIIVLGPERCSATCWPAWPCFFGNSHRNTFFDFTLRNGWVVEDCWLEVDMIGVNSGAYFEREPTAGSTDPRAVMVVWADGLSRAECEVFLTIRGPRGVDYF